MTSTDLEIKKIPSGWVLENEGTLIGPFKTLEQARIARQRIYSDKALADILIPPEKDEGEDNDG